MRKTAVYKERRRRADYDAENKSEAMLGVCLQNRYNKSSQFVKRYFQNKKIDFAFGNVLWHRDKAYYASGEWRGKKETEGGGVLINQAIHTLDLMQWICGEPTSVCANTYNYSLKDVIEVEDTAVALFKGDTDFEFFATNTAKTDLPVEIRFIAGGDIVTLYPDKVLINGDVARYRKRNRMERETLLRQRTRETYRSFLRLRREKRKISD